MGSRKRFLNTVSEFPRQARPGQARPGLVPARVPYINYSTSQGPFDCEDLVSPCAAFVTNKVLHGGFFVLQCGGFQRSYAIALQLFYLTLTSARVNVFDVGSSRKSTTALKRESRRGSVLFYW